jgi:cytochrome c
MKKTILVLSAVVLFIACGGNDEKKAENNETASTEQKTEDPELKRGFDMIAKSDCFTCHKTSEKSTGPAYTVVAAAYENNQESIDYLAGKIISGGSGKFGEIPMTPHPTLALDSAKIMAKYVLSLKDNK